LQPDTAVEFMLALATATGPRTEISCRGRVVRMVDSIDRQRLPWFAVAIEQYDFIPPPRAVTAERQKATQ